MTRFGHTSLVISVCVVLCRRMFIKQTVVYEFGEIA